MEKMRMETPNLTDNNIEKIGELFPNCITEAMDENGNLKKAINFDILKQMLSEDINEGPENYEFTWVGKKAAMVEANRPIRKTLRPCPEESVNWDTTENLYIEGDNLEALKLLQESYLGKVKMIYIDPPYNTGNDFIYKDDFKKSKADYEEEQEIIDEEGNRLIKNTETNGRFHSDWCSMMYSRLLLAKNLLHDDGSIFVSCDDNEEENTKKICDEIFGEQNFVSNICWHKKTQPSFLSKSVSNVKEYILMYKKMNQINTFGGWTDSDKHIEMINISNEPSIRELKKENVIIENGKFSGIICKGEYGNGLLKIYLIDDVAVKNGIPQNNLKLKGRFKWTQNTMDQSFKEGDIFHIKNSHSLRPTVEKKEKSSNIKPILDLFSKKINPEIPTNTDASSELKKLFGGINIMDYPKPSGLIKYIVNSVTFNDKEAIILDFFSGSATTADSVINLNLKDLGKRKFILVQIPQKLPESSEASKIGLKDICEIGKERIRRAAKKLAEDNPEAVFDGGFRVLKIDDSNMKDVYYSADEYSQDFISLMESNIKEDRTDLDLLFGCLTEWGIPLNLQYKDEVLYGKKVYTYNHGDLIACFAEDISEDLVKEIAGRNPMRVVFRDSCFKNSPDKINVTEIFKLLSPDTSIKVL